jgi:Mg-chelatase subunit ChlD
MEKKVRSRYFVLSGGLGGLVGFVLMEVFTLLSQGSGSRMGDVVRMAFYFAGFGLAVGAGLGMTEGYVQKKRGRMVYGLIMGLVLGVAGGFVGGAVGQMIYGLVPVTHKGSSQADVAIALDSSSSMTGFLFFFGAHDPHGKRRQAARELVDRLSENDRVAIVDFDEAGTVFFPLTALDSQSARDGAKQAIDQIDDSGGTNLSAGLDTAVEELVRNKEEGRQRCLIFLTDGDGYYDVASAARAKAEGIVVYTIGLGAEVNAGLLSGIAQETGGKYYPVQDASNLSLLFETIYEENLDMATRAESAAPAGTQQTDLPLIHILLRILSWAVMGLAIGAGQGVRENTREDLRACSLGGFLGGAVGGAMFDPIASLVGFGAGLVGRGLADVVVGACIGGSMRLAQQHMVEMSGKETKTLLSVLPVKPGLVMLDPEPAGRVPPAPAASAPVQPVKTPPPAPPPAPAPAPAKAVSGRNPLAAYQEKYADRAMAMAMAYKSGDFTLKEIAEHFGVQSTTVKRAADQLAGR